jgi:hypothetical protein
MKEAGENLAAQAQWGAAFMPLHGTIVAWLLSISNFFLFGC